MSNVKKSNKNKNLEIVSKDKSNVECSDECFENKIEVPKSSNSNSNDISKINSSFFSSDDSQLNENKINFHKENRDLNIENVDSIVNEENSLNKKGSNLSSEKFFFDKFFEAEKLSGENNKKYLLIDFIKLLFKIKQILNFF